MAENKGKAQQPAEAVAPRKGKEGSRWFNERPSSEDVANWFKDSVKLPEGLEHDKYVSGVTLIPQSEKEKVVVGFRNDGDPIKKDIYHQVYVPYVKVETRVQYFHDLMAQHTDDWEGHIEPVAVKNQDPNLPPGFFYMLVKTGEGQGVRYVCCSMKVTVFKRGSVKINQFRNTDNGEMIVQREGELIIDAPPATKMIPILGRQGPDPFSLMKAETGAIGRALGLAGMLIVPGTGVATAEDLQEAQDLEGVRAQPESEAPAAPAEEGQAARSIEPSEEDLRKIATTKISELQEDHPDRHAKFLAWAKERKVGKLSDADVPVLKGIIKKVEKELDEAQKDQQGE